MQAISNVLGGGLSALLPTYWPGVGDDPGSEWDPSGAAGNEDGDLSVLGPSAEEPVLSADQLATLIDPAFWALLRADQPDSLEGPPANPSPATTQSNYSYDQFGTPTTVDIAALGATLDLLDNNELPSDWQPPPTSLPHDQQLTNNTPTGTTLTGDTTSTLTTTFAPPTDFSILGIARTPTAFDMVYA